MKNLLSLQGVQKLSKEEQKNTGGGTSNCPALGQACVPGSDNSAVSCIGHTGLCCSSNGTYVSEGDSSCANNDGGGNDDIISIGIFIRNK